MYRDAIQHVIAESGKNIKFINSRKSVKHLNCLTMNEGVVSELIDKLCWRIRIEIPGKY